MRFMMPSRRDDSETLCILFSFFFALCCCLYACVCLHKHVRQTHGRQLLHTSIIPQTNELEVPVFCHSLGANHWQIHLPSSEYILLYPPVSFSFFSPSHDTQLFFCVCVCFSFFFFSDWRVTQKLPAPPPPLLSHMTKKLLGRSFHLTLDCQIIIS